MKATRVLAFSASISFFLFIWEIAYRLEFIDAVRVSHPLAIFQVLTNPAFLRGFGILLLQVAFASLVGGAIGVGIAAIVRFSDWLTWSAIRFLRLGQWLPFFVLWGYPLGWWWSPKDSSLDVDFWSKLIAWTIVLIVPLVALAACYHRLSITMLIQAKENPVRCKVLRAVVFHTLLVCLLFQLYFTDEGWPWYWLVVKQSAAVGWAVMILLAVLMSMGSLVFRSTFDNSANLRRATLTNELQNCWSGSLLGASVIAFICAVLWLMLDEAWKKALLVALPKDVVLAAYRLLIAGANVVDQKSEVTIWSDIGLSALEIAGGLIAAGLVALAISRILSREIAAKNFLLTLLPSSSLVSIGVWLILFFWVGIGILLKVALVACLVFFPILQAFWSFKENPLLHRVLIAVDEALPLAFVAMLIGEAYGSTAGLGFVKLVASAKLAFPESVAASLITFAFLAVISATLRWIIKRLYFSNGADQVTVAEVT